MITYLVIGLLVEIIRMAVRYLRNLWKFEDFKNPSYVAVALGNLIITPFIWPLIIMMEIVEYFLRKRDSAD